MVKQTLATIGLWAASAYLAKAGRPYWITLLPAAFMTVVITSYFFIGNECLGPLITAATGNPNVTYVVGLVIGLALSIVLLCLFIPLIAVKQKNTLIED